MSEKNKIKNFTLNFNGYYLSAYDFPEKSGIYCIYASDGKNVNELLYIGKAKNLKQRIQQHTSTDYLSKYQYAYSFALLSEVGLDIVEAALVFRFNPKDNKNLKDKYTYQDVELTLQGKCHGLQSDTAFIVYQDSERF